VIVGNSLDLVLIGVGGVLTPNDVDAMLDAGADFVHVATAFIYEPFLAYNYKM